ncbi:MAG: hypothetical protein JW940_22320 [Polyangiaceae bacterium]|nr:hypothetical protein [Polyangiaceae bacterium]
MTADDLLHLLRDQHVAGEVKKLLGVPDEPVVAALHELQEGHTRLQHALQQLAEGQQQLVLAQARTEQRVEQLADAQARTEQRVEQLADAQARTEQRVEQLADAQARTEQRVEQLAQAQTRTEQRMQQGFGELREAIREMGSQHQQDFALLRSEMGNLGRSFGSWVEDTVTVDLPPWLERKHGLVVRGELATALLVDAAGREHEFDGSAEADGSSGRVLLLCEAKARVHERDVQKLVSKRDAVAPTLDLPVQAVLVGQWLHPRSGPASAEAHVILVSTRQLRRD